jgi:flagellar hook-associated protein 3 FlgL
MRISTSSFTQNMSNNIKDNLNKYQDLQNRISAGGQLTSPSEDPLAYSYVNKLKDARNQIQQFGTTAKKLQNDLDFYDSTFGSVQDLLKNIRTVAVRAANSTLDDVDRKNMANEVNSNLEQMVALGNANVQGKYMFAGSRNTDPPFTMAKGVNGVTHVTYTGDTTTLHREVGFNDKVAINFNGKEVFANTAGTGIDIFNEIVALRDDILTGDNSKITAHLGTIDAASQQVMSFRATNGNTINHLTNLENTWEQLDINYAKNMDQVGTLDMATLINALNTQQVTYQATLYIAGTIGKISLLNYMTQ